MEQSNIAVGIIDTQRGFMPLSEGDRLNLDGFGELPVPDGEQIVPVINQMVEKAKLLGAFVFTTQDWHPYDTAHFADEPNYTTTWPRHCVQDTPGAELHPGLVLPSNAVAFKKGNEALIDGAEDTSYTGFNGINELGQTLAERLIRENIAMVYLGGLATDYCLKATALDLRNKLGLTVQVNLDAARGVAPESTQAAIEEMVEAGIVLTKEDQVWHN